MSAVGPLLSEFRKKSRLSQLELSLLADVSSRHISFIETGRTQPSRAMLMRPADVLNLPHKDSNLLLHSGGYAAAYSELQLDSSELEPVRHALGLILDNHNPYPALVMDGDYNVVMANSTQQVLLTRLLKPGQELPAGLNVLEAVFSAAALRPVIVNWDTVASHLLRRLRKQVLAFGKPSHTALLARLESMSPPPDWQQPKESQHDGPMLTVDFQLEGQILSTFTTLSQFGSALDIGIEELMIESYFPADNASRKFFEALGNSQ